MAAGNPMMEPVPGVEPTKGGYYLWRYAPNKGVAVLFLLLFLASFLFISWRTVKTRTWFCVVFAVGCLFEVVGYGARISSAGQTGRIMTFAIQNSYILLGPAIFAASIYMTLGRLISSIRADSLSPIKPSRLTKLFVSGDVLSFVIQGGGAGMMMIQKNGLPDWGERIIILGLVVQVVLFGLFGVVAVVFHRRMRGAPTLDSLHALVPWEQTLHMLYMVSVLIMIRSIFRLVEYIGGPTGYLLSHEWTLYVFDSLLMFAVTVLFAWRFPSELRPNETIPLGGWK